jgi:uncharacterized protein
VEVLRSSSVRAFLDLAGDYLAEREAENNLIFGITSSIQADPTQFQETPYFATVMHGGRVVGAAMRTPPWRLVLADIDHPGAVHRIATDLTGTHLPGVVGPKRATSEFAHSWHERTGARSRLSRHERAYRLTHVREPRPAPGEMVVATPADRRLIAEWLEAFDEEAHTGPPGRRDYDETADRLIERRGRTAYLWKDAGRTVSLTGVGGRTPNGIRVGPVYTPPELRGRGYASNLVAQASQAALDDGRTFVFLFTDLANPTANHIYQSIGYEPVCDIDEWEFA